MKTTLNAPLNVAEINAIYRARLNLQTTALALEGLADPVELAQVALEVRERAWELHKAIQDGFTNANLRAFPPRAGQTADRDYLTDLGLRE